MYKNEDIDLNLLLAIEHKIKHNINITNEEFTYFISNIIYLVRDMVITDNNEFFDYKCDLVQSILAAYFEDLNIKYNLCDTQKILGDYVIGHRFTTATFNVNNQANTYLIDPTYRQFFHPEKCSHDNYIVYNNIVIKTPDPGYFITETDSSLINELNYYGYHELTEELARIYGDSFYNTKTMRKDTAFVSMKGYVYLNSFQSKNQIAPSKNRETLEKEGYNLHARITSKAHYHK